MLLFKKILGPLVLPVPVITILLGAGIVLLWFSKKQKTGKVLTTVGLVLLMVFSFRPVPHTALRSLERTYDSFTAASYTERDVQWIVVLSGGYTEDLTVSPVNRLGETSLVRLIEGLTLLQQYPEARLVLTGGNVFIKRTISSAAAMKDVAVLLGVDPDRVVLEEESEDTKDHAVLVGRMVGEDPFILVTSASHMRRSVALFRKQGLDPIPAPTGHLVKDQDGIVPGMFFPSSDNLRDATTFFYETYGYLWSKMRGQI